MPQSVNQLLTRLETENPEALLLEPRDVYDVALVGLTDSPKDNWGRTEKKLVATYSTARCLEAIMEWLKCDYSEAQDWFYFNTAGAYAGNDTPTFVDLGDNLS